jgi:integrase
VGVHRRRRAASRHRAAAPEEQERVRNENAFKRFGREAGLHPSTLLHDVRHAVATELGRQGVHGVVVSAVLGHASPAFTIAVYQHAWQEGPYEAAAALEKAFASGLIGVGNPLANEDLEASNERASIAN